MSEIHVKNIVIQVTLTGRDKLLLHQIYTNLRDVKITQIHAEYNPDAFPGLVLKYIGENNRKITALIFSTCKLILVGAKELGEAKIFVERFVRALNLAGAAIMAEKHMQVHNYVCLAQLSQGNIDLENAFTKLPHAVFEPETFPGMILQRNPKTIDRQTFLLFKSGKVVLTGNSDMTKIKRNFLDLQAELTSLDLI